MEYAKKMVLVPEDRVDRKTLTISPEIQYNNDASDNYEKKNSVQTSGTPLSRLDVEMSEILKSKDYESDRDKWNAYSQALQRYLRLIENERQRNSTEYGSSSENDDKINDDQNYFKSISMAVDKNPQALSHTLDINDSIIASIPKKFKNKATLLLRRLKKMPPAQIAWDEKGVVSINGAVIAGSNIIDLLNDAMRPRKNVFAVGRNQFAAALQQAQVPKEYIGNNQLWGNTVTIKTSTPAGRKRIIPELTDDYSPTSSSSNSSSVKSVQKGHGTTYMKKIRWAKLKL